VLGAPVAAGLLLLDGRGGLRGWQYLFLVLGLVTAAYALVVAVRVPTRAARARPLRHGRSAVTRHDVFSSKPALSMDAQCWRRGGRCGPRGAGTRRIGD
jgi:predicted MFS family arabinose efflux permease